MLSRDESLPRPHIAVVGALHGNETCGLHVIERVLADPEAIGGSLTKGTLIFVHGNPRATEQRRRFTKGGSDINRLFKYEYVDDLALEAWTYEHHRALELQPLIADVDAMLDIHSASRPTQPFAICDGRREGIELARRTGCHVTYGWDGPGMLMEHVSIGALVARGSPALSVECGQHESPDAESTAWLVFRRFLAALELVDDGELPEPGASYRLFGRVVKPTHAFELSRDFASFDRLAPGELLGQGDGVSIRVEEEAYLLLPTPTAVRGEDLVYLARKET